MDVTAIAPWFGAKRTMASDIVGEIGEHKVFWEPFCGSLAVLLAKPRVRQECVNDLHGDLVNLARTIRCSGLGPELYRRLRRTLFCEDLFRESRAIIKAELPPRGRVDVDRAYHYFVASWMGMSGTAGTATTSTGFARRFSSQGGAAGTRWHAAISSIPQWRKRLQNVEILNTCGLEVAEKIEDRAGTVIYCDPPYLVKGAKYLHDFKPEDHERLAKALCRFKETRVIVSYYDHPKLEQLYPGWRKRHVVVTKSMVNQGKRDQKGAADAPEVLLCNDAGGRPNTSQGLFEMGE